MPYCAVRKEFIPIRLVHTVLLLVLMPVFLTGCLTLRTPVELEYTSGAVVTSFSSNASFSYAASGRSVSGSGYLLYRTPDQMRAVILSPFGSVLQEVYLIGDLITIIDTGNGIAFSGTSADLPDKGNFSGWRNIHWIIDIDPPDSARNNSVIERINRFGHQEKATFENGLLVSKSSAADGFVKYNRYTVVQGAAFPLEITYETVAREKFSIRFEDLESNTAFAAGAFVPNLAKLRVYPLSSLK